MRRIPTILASAVFGLTVSAYSAKAVNLVTNGSFELTTLPGKGTVKSNGAAGQNVTGWNISRDNSLTFLDPPGTATSSIGGFAVYPGFPSTSPDGGKFIEADGDPGYSATLSQTIHGLIVGTMYTLTFEQAAGQQNNFPGRTTERWKVSLGSDTQLSPLFSLAQGAFGAWITVTMKFTATATSELLSFLAVGTPSGAPPVSFLDGVDLEVPEPMTVSLMGAGLIGLGLLRRRSRPAA